MGRGKPRPRRRRLLPHGVPRPDAAAAAVRDADETAAEAPDEGADGRPRGRPSADDAAVAAAAATRMPLDDKQPPSPASCRRPLSPRRRRRLRLLLLLLEPAVAPQSYHPLLPGSRQIGCFGALVFAAPMITTTGGHNSFAGKVTARVLRGKTHKLTRIAIALCLSLSDIIEVDRRRVSKYTLQILHA